MTPTREELLAGAKALEDADATKECAKCKTIKELSCFRKDKKTRSGYRTWCKTCLIDGEKIYKKLTRDSINAVRREYRKRPEVIMKKALANARYKVKNRKKMNAYAKFRRALMLGRLVKQPCFICGNEKSLGHHPDYDAPVDVIWLCINHHAQLHSEHLKYSGATS